MTTQWLEGDIKADEGYSATSYPDPLTGGEPFTCCWGHTGDEVKPGMTYLPRQCEAFLESDLAFVKDGLDATLPWWRSLNDARQDVFVNASFNMGVTGFYLFHHTLAAVQDEDWVSAAAGLLASKWATQVPRRAKRLAQQMLTGVRVPPT